ALAEPRPRLRLGPGVVVRGDGRGAEVGPLADLGVADVGQVRDLRAGADVGVLDLDERARLAPAPQDGAGAQVRVGADGHAVLGGGTLDPRVACRHLVAEVGVGDGRVGADAAALADAGRAAQRAAL